MKNEAHKESKKREKKSIGMLFFNIIILILSLFIGSTVSESVICGEINASNQGSYVQGSAVALDTPITLTFYVASINSDKLEGLLADISNPSSPNYGKYLSTEELLELTTNKVGQTAVTNYLKSLPATINDTGSDGNQISATAPASLWQTALNAVFYTYTNADNNALIRTPSYSLPAEVCSVVSLVSPTTQFPVAFHHGPVRTPS